MFRTILLPADGSEYSLRAVEYAADLALRYSSQVTVVHVVEMPAMVVMYPEADRHADIRQDLSKHGMEVLSQAVEICRTAGVEVNQELLYGSAVPSILQYARDGEYELIVIGARGTGTRAVDQILIGSVAEGILHSAPCPVLMVRLLRSG